MTITDPLVLPADVVLVPVAELPAQVREQVEYEDGDYAITRPRARTPSKIVDAHAAELLKEFQMPKTIVEAVIGYSRATKTNPEKMLEDAFPMIQRFLQSRILVPADSDEVNQIVPNFDFGDQVAGCEVIRCIQVLEDTELYQVKYNSDELAALKILRPNSSRQAQHMFDRETAILRLLDGSINPMLLEAGTIEHQPYLVMAWCPGVDAPIAAEELRRQGSVEGRKSLLDLCCAILDAYTQLHGQLVIHSDIHPRNILVDGDGMVKIIDYGFARHDGFDNELSRADRAGVGFFFEPEYAKAYLAQRRPPQSSMLGEQYALAAMLYLLLTGSHYLDFSLERREMLRQIAEDSPLPFAQRDVRSWPGVEQALFKALSKEPLERFTSLADFANELREAAVPDAQSRTLGQSKTQPRSYAAAEELLNNVLQRLEPSGSLFTSGLPTAPTCSINFGAAGIAYALYRVACNRQSAGLLSLADLWCAKALRDSEDDAAFYNAEFEITPETVGAVSPYHTVSGVYGVQALISHAMGDLMTQQAAIESFILASSAPCENLDLTLGRSSTLLACSLLLDTITSNDVLDDSSLLTLGDGVMEGIWDEINTLPPIRECSEITNLGIAHGWAGFLYATMRWCLSSGRALPKAVEERLQQLAVCAEPIGRGARWKWELEKHTQGGMYHYMPGWCNGSAGYVHLWTLAHQVFRDEAYLNLAEKAAWNTWEEPYGIDNLCCGLAGRAYGLLSFYKHTGQRDWLYRAQELGDRAVVASGAPDMPRDSLYKGEVGVAVLAADLGAPEASCMPFFEQEGWPARHSNH